MMKSNNSKSKITYREAIAYSMKKNMVNNKKVIIIGQGVTDHKGTFGTTLNLNKKFPNRIIETPISEDSVAGICVGLSLKGMYPINTHIRADFSLLIFNQLINLIAKYKYMFGGLWEVPMLFRLVVGRSWGQGAQHSQSLQSLLSHIPGLTVIMPSSADSIIKSYNYAINKYKGPVVSFEHRLLYEIKFNKGNNKPLNRSPFNSKIIKSGKDVTIIACSVMVLEALRASKYLEQINIHSEIIDLNCISHIDEKMILKSLNKTKKLIVIDTSWVNFGIASEISRIILKNNANLLSTNPVFLGMQPSPCPTAKKLEDYFYPDVADIFSETVKLLNFPRGNIKSFPKKESMTDYYKHFKGPF